MQFNLLKMKLIDFDIKELAMQIQSDLFRFPIGPRPSQAIDSQIWESIESPNRQIVLNIRWFTIDDTMSKIHL